MKISLKQYLMYPTTAVLFALFTALSGNALAACSSYKGKIVINEYNYIDNWIELKVLDTSVIGASTQFADWKLWVFKQSKPGSPASEGVGSMYSDIADNTCGTASGQFYIRIPFKPADLDNDVNVVLADKNNNIVDVLRVDQASLSTYYSGFNSCTITYSNLTDAPVTGTAGNKDIARLPDGTGPWVISPGTGSNSQQTLCGSNDGMLNLTKTPSTSTVGIGSSNTFTWTITVSNGSSKDSLSNVTVTDTLPTTPAQMYLSACPAGASCGGAAGAYTSISQNLGTLAASASASIIATAYVTGAGTYVNTASVTATELSPGYTQASGTVITSSAPGSFNAFETSTAAAATSGRIYTKLAGAAFSLDVVAISSGTQSSGFTNNVKVELLANTGTAGGGYGTDNCPTSNAIIQMIASAGITSGRSTVNFTALANAYRDVRVRISYPTTAPTVSSCSTDSFAIRPAAFTVTSTDAGNNATTGAPAIKAGANFNLTATALAGYDGTPVIDNTKVTGTTTAGTIAGTFGAANSATGVATGSTFTYSEVGNFGLNSNAVYGSSFTSIDQPGDCTADFSNTLVGGQYGCKIGSIAVTQTTGSSGFGRFIPDHFDTELALVSGVPMTCPDSTCPVNANGINGAVYSGQSFTENVLARNLAGATTTNYAGSYAHAVTLSAWDALGSTVTQNPAVGTLAVATAAAFTAGVSNNPAQQYAISATTPPVNVFMRAKETASDGVTSLRTVPGSSVEAGVKVVSGRVKVSNAYGSELLPLKLTATVQYYTAAGWVTSSTDNVSSLTLAASYDLIKNAGITGTTAASKSPASGLLAGVLTINLAKPVAAGASGTATISPTAPSYLPVIEGKGTFGVYKGSNNFIYQRESY